MRKIVVIFIAGLYFGQVSWENELVDSVMFLGPSGDFIFNTLALDYDQVPHVAYNRYRYDMWRIAFASRTDTGWLTETVDSTLFYYGPSLILDDNNVAHLSYYEKDDTFKTYICYARREASAWQIEIIDTIAGYLGNYFWHISSSIDLDTSGLPGIAYIAWNVEDSLHYIKYAHYNGTNWDTSVVEYDSAYANMQTMPTEYSPSLKFSSRNIPYIAFYHVYGLYHADTLKIAYYDDNLGTWIVNPVLSEINAGIPVSLALDSQDRPCIAHGYGHTLAYTWWDGSSWSTDYGIASIGWLHLRVCLDLDNVDRPHIAYLHWGFYSPQYCYKDTIWHLCGPIDPDTSSLTFDADISFALDDNDEPHVSYQFDKFDTLNMQDIIGLKYAKGIFVGIEQTREITVNNHKLLTYPNPAHDRIHFILPHKGMKIQIFDITGQRIWSNVIEECNFIWNFQDNKAKKLPAGVYFVRLETPDFVETEKVILLK